MITEQEKRFVRRELINHTLHERFTSFRMIKQWVRLYEHAHYMQSMKIYPYDTNEPSFF